MSNRVFHFTLGPVQGFVAQSRRTRDLWAGSFLLAYLSGIAMKITIQQGGRVLSPNIDNDPLFQFLITDLKHSVSPEKPIRTASLPNRFTGEADDPATVAKAAADGVKEEWRKIANEAMIRFCDRACTAQEELRETWERQVKNQWEISWVTGEAGSLLDQRKHLRTHYCGEENGEKCTLCGERQALAGKGKNRRSQVKKWWNRVAEQFNGKKGYHFLPGGTERLCAICTIKRIFPLVSQETIGFQLPHNYPSTAYMSAVDWLITVIGQAVEDPQKTGQALENLVNSAGERGNEPHVPYDEIGTGTDAITKLLGERKGWRPLTWFSGDLFFPDSIIHEGHLPLFGGDDQAQQKKREELVRLLSALTKAAGTQPTPFYALLMMDGDRMGMLMDGYPDERENISRALSEFSSGAEDIVEKGSNGRLVYAGGDDLLAFLPLGTSLECAEKLKVSYANAFRSKAPRIDAKQATISAALVYPHMNIPLQAVARDARSLLDDIAKEKLGRDAFAVRVWKRGGPVLTFGKKWEEKGRGEEERIKWVDKIEEIKTMLHNGEYTNGFLYRFIELIPIVDTLQKRDDKIGLLAAEFLKTREKMVFPGHIDPGKKLNIAKERVEKLLDLSLYAGNGKTPELVGDGPLFIRFLHGKEL